MSNEPKARFNLLPAALGTVAGAVIGTIIFCVTGRAEAIAIGAGMEPRLEPAWQALSARNNPASDSPAAARMLQSNDGRNQNPVELTSRSAGHVLEEASVPCPRM